MKKQPSKKQLEARKKFAEMSKARKKKYNLSVRFNDKVFELRTNDIKESLLALRPGLIKTRVKIELESEGKKSGRVLAVFPAKRVFGNSLSAAIMANRLITSLK